MLGYSLVMPCGSFSSDDNPTAVIALVQGGLVCIHDLRSDGQKPFSLEFQARAWRGEGGQASARALLLSATAS